MAYKKKYAVMALVGICAASGVAWWYQNQPTSPGDDAKTTVTAPPGAGPAKTPAVEVAKVESMTLVDETQSVGSLRSRQGVMMRPEVAGRVNKILFNDGQRVRQGQLLVQFDDQLPVAQLSQAKAEMSIAESNHKRNQELVSTWGTTSRTVPTLSTSKTSMRYWWIFVCLNAFKPRSGAGKKPNSPLTPCRVVPSLLWCKPWIL